MTAGQAVSDMEAGVKRQFVDCSIGQIHYRYRRPETPSGARPLVMFHGSPSSSRQLRHLIAEMGKSRTVIGFDTIGQGDSCPPPSADVTFQDYARYYREALSAMGPEFDVVDVFGTHTGARQAAEYAICNPANTGKVILDGMRRGPDAFWAEYSASVDLGQYIDQEGTQFFKAWNKVRDLYLFFPPYRRKAANFRGHDMPDAVEMHLHAIEVFKGIRSGHIPYMLALGYPSEERLPLITHPTLTTCAPLDGPYGDIDYVATLIPGAKAMPHPQKARIEEATAAEVAALGAMLARWLDETAVPDAPGTSC